MHHDESLHATYAWYLFKGRGYSYNPIMHGPLQFYVMAFLYMLFGDNETTARLFAVICGSGIVALPYFLRREIGRYGALTASLVLAISPTFLYFSRFARDDIYLDFFSLLMVLAMWSYLRERRPAYVYLLAFSAALAMVTMEASYITFFIFGSFVLLALLKEWLAGPSSGRAISEALRSIPLDAWLYSICTFGVTVVLLYSSFLSNPYGIWDPRHSLLSPDRQDILGGITYWISQHGVARGGQPWFYYLLLFPLYEQIALVFGLCGAVWAILRRNLFTTFLLYWALLAIAIYSWAGEKMPWLFLHLLLPTILLAATFIGQLLTGLRGSWRLVLVGFLAILLVMEAHSAQALAYADGANPTEMLVYVQTSNDVPAVSKEVLRLVHRTQGNSPPPFVQVDNADLGGWPFEWYFRNLPAGDVSYDSNFSNPTAPILLMLGPEYDLYNTSLNHRYTISQYRWNWWFPEDYKGLTFDNGMCETPQHEVACKPGQKGVVFLKTGAPCHGTQTQSCSPIQTPAAINVFHAVVQPSTWRHLWSWFVFRRPFGQRSSRMLYIYVRKDLVSGRSGALPPSPPFSSPAPGNQNGFSRLGYRQTYSFGGTGSNQGQLLNPRGVTTGPGGNVYVADAGNHRVDIFGPTGRFLRSFGTAGLGRGEFNNNESPMDVAVSPQGNIYVADWWGDRVEEFDANGRFLRSWGHYGTHGGYGFFGPRSLAVGRNGNVYVADTGNRQIAVFSSSGRFRFRFGSSGSGSGQFQEPSSVLVGPHDDVYVTDMWNSRIQRFDAEGHFLGSWAVPTWAAQSYEEPFAAALANGNVVATDPANGRILEFGPTGKRIGAISSSSMSLPIGIATGIDGRIYVTDSHDNKVLVFAPLRKSGRLTPSAHLTRTRAPRP